MVFVLLSLSSIAIAELPKQLQDALVESREPGKELQAAGVLRRYANSDDPRERVLSRTTLARIDREAGHPQRAQTWVKEYSQPIPENYEWPRAAASIEYAHSAFALGQTFEAVKRLNGIKDHAQGLGRIYAQRALSVISEQQPDLSKALAFEKGALSTGKKYFKREKISESAGYADHKAGHGHWKRLQPQINERIKELERLLDIEKYGLDYVLYREAQMYRKADHPLAMDFTHVAAAFRIKEPMASKVPGADYEKALESYALLIESFDQNPYSEAAKLYSAVCKVHMGEADQAIRDLKAFYKENPDGLYRGEALKIIGDIYLFHKWDQINAEEAYNRSVNWLEAMKGRSRILTDYLVPEKSQKVSKPPVRVKVLTEEGLIKDITIPTNALVNRNSSKWYLDTLRVEVEWRLGFLDVVMEKWDQAMDHFVSAKDHDVILQKADRHNFFNAFNRLKAAKRNKSLIATQQQLKGIKGRVKTVMMWGDFLFLTEYFYIARSIYSEIEKVAVNERLGIVYVRAVAGRMLVKRQLEGIDGDKDVVFMHQVVEKNPKANAAPLLLELCATYTFGKPMDRRGYLKWIYTKYPNSKYASQARYYEILHGPKLHEIEKRRSLIEKYKKDFPHELERHRALDELYVWYIKELEEQTEALEKFK